MSTAALAGDGPFCCAQVRKVMHLDFTAQQKISSAGNRKFPVPGTSQESFGRRRVPKIVDGLTIFIYCELQKGRWIPGDGPELLDATTATLDTGILRSHHGQGRPILADWRSIKNRKFARSRTIWI